MKKEENILKRPVLQFPHRNIGMLIEDMFKQKGLNRSKISKITNKKWLSLKRAYSNNMRVETLMQISEAAGYNFFLCFLTNENMGEIITPIKERFESEYGEKLKAVENERNELAKENERLRDNIEILKLALRK